MAKRAVLIGCNYPGTKAELHGCVNDVSRMYKSLVDRFGFDEEDITVLVDTDKRSVQPTGANIKKVLGRVIEKSEPGDILVLHYSGHGTQVPAESGDEEDDGLDEAIVPCDLNLLTDYGTNQFIYFCLGKCLSCDLNRPRRLCPGPCAFWHTIREHSVSPIRFQPLDKMAYLHTTPSLVGLNFRDAHMVKRRVNENRMEGYQKFIKDDGLAKLHTTFIDHADNRGANRRAAENKVQEEKVQAMEMRVKEQRFNKMQREDNERLANFRAEERRQRMRDELILEALKDKSPEIRELKRLLQTAQMTKERYEQQHDKTLYEKEDDDRNAAFHEMLMAEYNRLTKIEQERLQKIVDAKIEVKRKLDEQMKEKEWEMAMHLREKQHDKELVDAVVAREAELDRIELEKRKETIRHLQEFIKEYLIQKEELERATERSCLLRPNRGPLASPVC